MYLFKMAINCLSRKLDKSNFMIIYYYFIVKMTTENVIFKSTEIIIFFSV